MQKSVILFSLSSMKIECKCFAKNNYKLVFVECEKFQQENHCYNYRHDDKNSYK